MLPSTLRPIEARGALEVAARAHRWAGEDFSYAVVTGRANDDPTIALKGALETGQVVHYPALHRHELDDFPRALPEYPGRPETRLAITVRLLTFVRPGELRPARWSEFDLDGQEWRIPPQRMKSGAEPVVPLSRQAVDALKELRTLSGHSHDSLPERARTCAIDQRKPN